MSSHRITKDAYSGLGGLMPAKEEHNWSEAAASLEEKQRDALEGAHKDPSRIPQAQADELQELGIVLPRPEPLPASSPTEESLELLQRKDTTDALGSLAEKNRLTSRMRDILHKVLRGEDGFDSLGAKARCDAVSMLHGKIREQHEELESLAKQSPEHFFVIKGAEARKWMRQLQSGRIAQTPYVQEKINEVCSALASGKIAFLHGETGAGKTEVARLAAREVSGQDPIVVRGYAGMDSAALFGHTVLKSSARDHSKVTERIESELEKWKAENPHATDRDVAKEQDIITRSILTENNVTITEFHLGAIYQAARDGRVVILDEANYIPPPLLAALNDILTKRPGECIGVQENGADPIVVKGGFSVIMTGNINRDEAKRYLNRYEIDPALSDRSHFVGYEALPQATDGLPKDHRAEHKQLFSVLVASLVAKQPRPIPLEESPIQLRLVDRVGSLVLPEGGLDAVWRLSQLAAVTQLALGGRITHESEFAYQKDAVQTAPKISNALSPRRLIGILDSWRADGFQEPLDSYLQKSFIEQELKRDQREYLTQLAQKFGFLGERPDQHSELEVITGDEILEALFGEIPMRTTWPDATSNEQAQDQADTATRITYLATLDPLLNEVDELLETWKPLFPHTEESQ